MIGEKQLFTDNAEEKSATGENMPFVKLKKENTLMMMTKPMTKSTRLDTKH